MKSCPGNVGSIVYFDELIGDRRIKSHAIVKEIAPNSRIVWQLKALVRLPIWVELDLNENGDTLEISHKMKLGFRGVGRCLDLVFRSIVSRKFQSDLNEHVIEEFCLLAKHLGSA